MSEPITRINAFRAAVVARINAAMPALRHCEAQFGRFDLDELERTSLPSPAVRLAVLKATAPAEPGGRLSAKLSCAAFIVTEGRDREKHAWAVAEGLATLLHPGQLWDLTRLAAPAGVEIQPMLSLKLRQRGVVIMAVEWTQEIHHLGDGIWDAHDHLIEGLYLNDEEVEPAEAEGDVDE